MVCRLSIRDTHARFLRLASVALFALALIGASGDARAEAVAVELILAIDCSSSVQPEEYAMQMRGVADAFGSSEVIQAIASGLERSDRVRKVVDVVVVSSDGTTHR
ncbi:MAG: hypothetical protein CL885_00475 [Dehalococcoidia bacterium]|nr:hypothetical protein [Dehalococcoidia bacterium]